MRYIVIKCDKCKKLLAENEVKILLVNEFDGSIKIELCKDCYQEVFDFIYGIKNVNMV